MTYREICARSGYWNHPMVDLLLWHRRHRQQSSFATLLRRAIGPRARAVRIAELRR